MLAQPPYLPLTLHISFTADSEPESFLVGMNGDWIAGFVWMTSLPGSRVAE